MDVWFLWLHIQFIIDKFILPVRVKLLKCSIHCVVAFWIQIHGHIDCLVSVDLDLDSSVMVSVLDPIRLLLDSVLISLRLDSDSTKVDWKPTPLQSKEGELQNKYPKSTCCKELLLQWCLPAFLLTCVTWPLVFSLPSDPWLSLVGLVNLLCLISSPCLSKAFFFFLPSFSQFESKPFFFTIETASNVFAFVFCYWTRTV